MSKATGGTGLNKMASRMPFNLKVTFISRHIYNSAFGREDRTFAINVSLEKDYYIVTNDFMCT